MKLLEVRNLSISSPQGVLVRNLDFDLDHGQSLGLLGQSGAGKSLSAMSLCGLLPKPLLVSDGSISLHGEAISPNDPKAWHGRRGKEIFLVFQSPTSALDPTAKVGAQIAEALVEVRGWHQGRALKRACQLLDAVDLPAATAQRYAFELSGGMRQRVLIAIALALRPQVLITDEPTTGLDPVNQLAVLNLLKRMQKEHHTALLIISHDLRVISFMARHALIMEKGLVVERGPTLEVMRHPSHPHTADMIDAMRCLEPFNA
ncbi:MAG: ABC transporter ATP-binding protein [Desulfarculaceae bacterium]|jgi:ABC-type glutathione transport system ATPase component